MNPLLKDEVDERLERIRDRCRDRGAVITADEALFLIGVIDTLSEVTGTLAEIPKVIGGAVRGLRGSAEGTEVLVKEHVKGDGR